MYVCVVSNVSNERASVAYGAKKASQILGTRGHWVYSGLRGKDNYARCGYIRYYEQRYDLRMKN